MGEDDSTIVAREVLGGTTSVHVPVQVRFQVQALDNGSSRIHLAGSNRGIGPIQKNHMRGQVGAVANKIRLAGARRPSGSGAAMPAADLAGQLERLGKLRSEGLLSDAEFAAAKARLLGS
jgi:Short C-terminal domain